MWRPVAGRRFDLIVANLPHAALIDPRLPGRRPTWSGSGEDGRGLLDPFSKASRVTSCRAVVPSSPTTASSGWTGRAAFWSAQVFS
jgi:hypothetical protein